MVQAVERRETLTNKLRPSFGVKDWFVKIVVKKDYYNIV